VISKELLSEVLGFSVDNIITIDSVNINQLLIIGDKCIEINIYELAHKNLKQWAYNFGYILQSSYIAPGGNVKSVCNVIHTSRYEEVDTTSYAETEQAAIFKACEYILSNKEQHA